MRQPLEDIRVIDVSRVLAGPYCTMQLGDLGADVIKIEPPGRGDDSRHFGPPFLGGESSYYMCLNRNKRSITLDIRTEEGKRILLDLVARADVFVENWLPHVRAKLGIDYETLRRINPRLIYCNLSGFGPRGPYADRPGYDVLAQAVGGIMSVTGEPDGRPTRVGVAITDVTTGMFATQGILAALRVRDMSGEGQLVNTSLLQAEVGWLVYMAASYLASGEVPARLGNAHPSIVPYQSFPASDGEWVLAIGNDSQWRRFCQVVNRPEWAAEERYVTNPQRIKNRDQLIPMLETFFRAKTVDEWLEILSEADLPCAPINDMARVFADPQVQAMELVREVPHPTAGAIKLAGFPFELTGTPSSIRRHPPLLGEHTEEILTSLLEFTPGEIERLRGAGVV